MSLLLLIASSGTGASATTTVVRGKHRRGRGYARVWWLIAALLAQWACGG